MTIADWMGEHRGTAATVDGASRLAGVVERMLREPGVRDVYVVADDRLIGRISHRRLTHLVLAEHRRGHTRRQLIERVSARSARDIMDPHVVSARLDEELDNVLDRMLEHDIEDLPVLDGDGRLAGVVNLSAVLQVAAADETL